MIKLPNRIKPTQGDVGGIDWVYKDTINTLIAAIEELQVIFENHYHEVEILTDEVATSEPLQFADPQEDRKVE